jgi:hypothetical protein
MWKRWITLCDQSPGGLIELFELVSGWQLFRVISGSEMAVANGFRD